MIETVGYDLCFSSQLKSDKISKQIYQINEVLKQWLTLMQHLGLVS